MRRYNNAGCSCCGRYVGYTDHYPDGHPEPDLCERCYNEQEMLATLEWLDIFKTVEGAIQSPLHLFKFTFKTFEEKVSICTRLMDRGVITWTIKP